jgi:branched-chain amino acid transport system permease protein
MNLTQELLQYILSGASIGSTYAMVALGFNLIYNATHIINFAQGEFVMLGGMFCAFFWVMLGFPLFIAIAAAIMATCFRHTA